MNPNYMQAVFLRGHLRLLSIGMKNSQLSGKQILDKASAITGVTYKRGQYDQAVEDLCAFIEKEKEVAG